MAHERSSHRADGEERPFCAELGSEARNPSGGCIHGVRIVVCQSYSRKFCLCSLAIKLAVIFGAHVHHGGKGPGEGSVLLVGERTSDLTDAEGGV